MAGRKTKALDTGTKDLNYQAGIVNLSFLTSDDPNAIKQGIKGIDQEKESR
jgi:hypothetical protein